MKRTKVVVLLAIALLAVLIASQASQSLSSGVSRSTGLKAEGCVCHGADKSSNGAPNKNVEISWRISGNPLAFEPNKVYNLTFGAAHSDVPASTDADVNKGGFNLKVNVGTLAVAPGWEKFTQVFAPTEMGHTKDGDLAKGRNWSATWTAPASDAEPAIFTLFINTVNGDGANSELDHWNGATFVVLNKAGAAVGAGGAKIDPEKVGVNWLAHWVGIVSFLAVIATLLIYYFVLKYGESIHTTDHRDRKEK